MKQTWYLIKTSYWEYPTWRIKTERNGCDWFTNSAGGGMPIDGNEEIIKVQEAENEQELDWTLTSYGHYKEDFGNGWLSPLGEWTQCDYQGHSDVAYLILKSDERTLESKNYIKVSADYIFIPDNERFTRKQIQWLKKHGHENKAEEFEEFYLVV